MACFMALVLKKISASALLFGWHVLQESLGDCGARFLLFEYFCNHGARGRLCKGSKRNRVLFNQILLEHKRHAQCELVGIGRHERRRAVADDLGVELRVVLSRPLHDLPDGLHAASREIDDEYGSVTRLRNSRKANDEQATNTKHPQQVWDHRAHPVFVFIGRNRFDQIVIAAAKNEFLCPGRTPENQSDPDYCPVILMV